MIKRKRKKTVEQVIPVTEIEEITPVDVVDATVEVVDNVIIEDATVEEVTEKIVEEKPRDTRKKKEEVIEVVGPIEIESFVSLIKPEDYLGNAVEAKNVYKVHAIHGDKVTLKEKGIIVFATKISNLKRVK